MALTQVMSYARDTRLLIKNSDIWTNRVTLANADGDRPSRMRNERFPSNRSVVMANLAVTDCGANPFRDASVNVSKQERSE